MFSSATPHAKRAAAAACLVLAAALLGPAVSLASGAQHAKPAARETAESTAAVLPSGKDPLDHLRERLAEKLGGEAKTSKNKALPTTVKVVNKSDAVEPVQHGPRAARTAGGQLMAAADPSAHAAVRLAAIQREAVRAGLAAPSHTLAGHASHWDYHGEAGPQAWGHLKSEFATCHSGKRQSPIDIRDGLKLQLEPVQFSYRTSALRVIDTGHTVQVNVGAGNSIEVSGRRYELLQFHFHRPSEERIDGRQFDMVAHLVHKDVDGRLAVVAVLLNRGAAQPLIQSVWNNLPLEKGEEQPVRSPIDLNALLPAERSYYTYMGSLTTPPCTEGVMWMVMKTPVQISAEQIGIFARLYPMNARPLQAAGGRMIKESD